MPSLFSSLSVHSPEIGPRVQCGSAMLWQVPRVYSGEYLRDTLLPKPLIPLVEHEDKPTSIIPCMPFNQFMIVGGVIICASGEYSWFSAIAPAG
jgi:hypothetical protein|eukprot:COSAG01_NODE_871_length_13024_cov_115.041925_6_plen_94_part_00